MSRWRLVPVEPTEKMVRASRRAVQGPVNFEALKIRDFWHLQSFQAGWITYPRIGAFNQRPAPSYPCSTPLETDKMPETYRHTPDMGEISGFGDGYEACCQDMLEAGVKWLRERDSPALEGHTYSGIYGVLVADSDDAKAMEKAILDAAKGEATGAMHHAVMSRLFYIAKHGWPKYCEHLRARKDKED